ncbi:MAG TPA: hypothetical protein VFL85_04890 [Candidatus Saccharimonadales bacterium]|nr:hypothetical protein [Candidatus Saccharimonadales bacterium]
MADFLLLGQIPGTRIQITFDAWLYCLLVGLAAYTMYYLATRKQPLLTACAYYAAWRAVHRA